VSLCALFFCSSEAQWDLHLHSSAGYSTRKWKKAIESAKFDAVSLKIGCNAKRMGIEHEH
jgi:hypothetical protein